MLSQENINKLHISGIYKCEPVLEWLPIYKRNDPYWCVNWTFKVYKGGGSYFMYDTYWSASEGLCIELTDDNFDKFEYLFDLNDIRYVNSYESWLEYPENDRWCVGLDSGGMASKKYVVRSGAKKIKERVIERMQREINATKSHLASQERTLEGIINGEIDYNWY